MKNTKNFLHFCKRWFVFYSFLEKKKLNRQEKKTILRFLFRVECGLCPGYYGN